MKIAFKFEWPRKSVVATAPAECAHDWMNWSEPAPTVRPVSYGIFGGEAGPDRPCLEQERRCLKCNIYERRYA